LTGINTRIGSALYDGRDGRAEPAVRESAYDDFIMEHIRNARNFRVVEDATHRAHGSNPLCGDELELYLRIEGERILDAAFQCSCCGISMASASMLTEAVIGRTVAEARERARFLLALLAETAPPEAARDGIERALVATAREYPSRRRCAVLAWRTLEAALSGEDRAFVVG
jgi:nitrogen fixation NifU-like protein